MNREPTTYEELIRQKRCIDLTKYYNLTLSELEQIYTFLENNPEGQAIGNVNSINLVLNSTSNGIITAPCIDSSIDGLKLTNQSLTIIPHYTPSYSSGSSWSGSSSNNNNNINNNNNNR